MATLWTAGVNMPGYLPMADDVPAFTNRLDAMHYMVDELRRNADMMDTDADEAAALEEAADGLEGRDAEGGDWYWLTPDGRLAYWFQAVDVDDDEAREMLRAWDGE